MFNCIMSLLGRSAAKSSVPLLPADGWTDELLLTQLAQSYLAGS